MIFIYGAAELSFAYCWLHVHLVILVQHFTRNGRAGISEGHITRKHDRKIHVSIIHYLPNFVLQEWVEQLGFLLAVVLCCNNGLLEEVRP